MMTSPQIPQEVLRYCLVPKTPTSFLVVSKSYYLIALEALINSERTNDRLIEWLKKFIKKQDSSGIKIVLNNPSLFPSARKNAAIRAAIKMDFIEVIEKLIQHSLFDPRPMPFTYALEQHNIISYAAMHASHDTFRYLLDYTIFDPSDNYNLALRIAASKNDAHKVQLLMKDKRVDPSVPIDFDPDSREGEVPRFRANEALLSAAEEGFTDVVRVLLSDPRVTADALPALDIALQYNRTEVVKLLLPAFYAGPAQAGFQLACKYGVEEVVQAFLRDGRVDINANDGCALHTACRNKQIAIINILLAQPKINVMFLKPSYCFYAEEVREILSQAFREEKSS
jgi:ankyrin repeat protein